MDTKTYVPWLLAVTTILIGIWQYSDKQLQSNREPFLREQLRLVQEATEVVATLANTTDSEEWQTKRARFWVLYWGPLGMVEDRSIVQAMVEAGNIIPKTEQREVPELPLSALRQTALRLSHSARDLVLASWNVDLPPLQQEK